jgi:hypothetical protein
MFSLVCFHQDYQNIKVVTFRRVHLSGHEMFNVPRCGPVLLIRGNRAGASGSRLFRLIQGMARVRGALPMVLLEQSGRGHFWGIILGRSII